MHDPFCPAIECNCEPDEWGHEMWCDMYCICSTIAEVRADERRLEKIRRGE